MAAVANDNSRKRGCLSKACCAVPGCYEKYGNSNISMHKLPKVREKYELWIRLCRIENNVTKHSRICSVHFCESDFYDYHKIRRRKIRPQAVPSKRLPANAEEALKLRALGRSRKKKIKNIYPLEEINPTINEVEVDEYPQSGNCIFEEASNIGVNEIPVNKAEIDKNLLCADRILEEAVGESSANSIDIGLPFKQKRITAVANDNNRKSACLSNSCCAVPGCYEKYGKSNISMHQLPKVREKFELWIRLCRIEDVVTKHSRICSAHFSESDFYYYHKIKRRKIRPQAVPSKRLPANTEEALKLRALGRSRKKKINHIYPLEEINPTIINKVEVDEKPQSELLKIMKRPRQGGRCCAAVECKNKDYNIKMAFFRFPKDETRCEIWAKNSKRTDLLLKSAEYCYANCWLCAWHFQDIMFLNDLKNRLHSHAVPTRFMWTNNQEKQVIEDQPSTTNVEKICIKEEHLDENVKQVYSTKEEPIKKQMRLANSEDTYVKKEPMDENVEQASVEEIYIKKEPIDENVEHTSVTEIYIKKEPMNENVELASVAEIHIKKEPMDEIYIKKEPSSESTENPPRDSKSN